MVMLERRQAVNRAMERFLDGQRSWREAPERQSLLKQRPWLTSYDDGVPYTISVPPVRLSRFLASAAGRFPTRPAIYFQGRRISYRQLEREANRFSNTLPTSALPGPGNMRSRLLAMQPRRPPRVEVDPDGVAVLQYTGGTTDVAKGVMLTHRNLVANTLQTRHWIPDVRDGREVVLSVLPFSQIYGLMTAMSVPVAIAGAMVILPTFVTANVLQEIRRHRPTLFPGVPTMYKAINDFQRVRRFRVDSIRACISGAAPLPVEVQEAFEKLTRGRLVEGYGLAEGGPGTPAQPLARGRKP